MTVHLEMGTVSVGGTIASGAAPLPARSDMVKAIVPTLRLTVAASAGLFRFSVLNRSGLRFYFQRFICLKILIFWSGLVRFGTGLVWFLGPGLGRCPLPED